MDILDDMGVSKLSAKVFFLKSELLGAVMIECANGESCSSLFTSLMPF